MPKPHSPPIDKTKKRGVNATKAGRDERIKNLRRSRSTHNNCREYAEQRDPNRPLTDKQKLTIKFWAEGDTLRNALIRAGYSEGSVATLATTYRHDPAVMNAYHEAVQKVEKASDFSRKKFMDGLQEAADLAKLISEPGTMVAAYREMGRACGYYEPTKVQLDVNVKGNVLLQRMNSLTDEELLKLIDNPAIEGEFHRIEDKSGSGDEESVGRVEAEAEISPREKANIKAKIARRLSKPRAAA